MTLVPSVRPVSWAEIEKRAERLLKRHYPKRLKKPGPLNVLDFFEQLIDHHRLDMSVAQLPPGVEGITYPTGLVQVSEKTYRGASRNNPRDRFTVVHEAGHGLMHYKQLRERLVHFGEMVLFRREEIPPFRDPECQANVFAASMLAPMSMVVRLVESVPHHMRVDEVSSVFRISRQAAEIRLNKLKRGKLKLHFLKND